MSKTLQTALFFLFSALTISLIGCEPAQTNRYAQGEAIYKAACSDCHGDDGKGLKDLIPPLAEADFLVTQGKELACMLRRGMQDTIVVNGKKYAQIMPPQRLSAVEVTNVLNFIHHSWGNNNPDYTLSEIAEQVKNCPDTRD